MADGSGASDPLKALAADRAAAKAAGDANAELGWVATADAEGVPSVRTLVLRQLHDDWMLFINGTSPKWQDLQPRPRCEIAVWLPSLQRQWRLRARVRTLPRALLEEHWPRRPRISQVVDHAYSEGFPQSAALADPAALDAALIRLDSALGETPEPPDAALALGLRFETIECLQIARPPTPHQRQLWAWSDDAWSLSRIVP